MYETSVTFADEEIRKLQWIRDEYNITIETIVRLMVDWFYERVSGITCDSSVPCNSEISCDCGGKVNYRIFCDKCGRDMAEDIVDYYRENLCRKSGGQIPH